MDRGGSGTHDLSSAATLWALLIITYDLKEQMELDQE
jgi:hypothetical protein